MKPGTTDDVSVKRRPRSIPLPDNPTEDELARDWTISSVDHIEVSQCRGDGNRLRFAIQLCVLRKYCRFLDMNYRVPVRIVNHLCAQLDLPPTLRLEPPERDMTEYGHQKRIREYLDYHEFDEKIEAELSTWLAERALEGVLPEQLHQRAEQLLKTWHIVLPAVSTIERLVDSISARAKEEFYEFISSRLSNKLKKSIDELLMQTGSDRKTQLFHLKEYPPAANPTHLLEYIEHFELLDSILGDDFDTGVDPSMQKHLAQLVKRYDAAALKRFMSKKKRYALIACFLAENRKTVLDHIVALHDQYMTETTRKCKNKHDKKLKEGRRKGKHGMSIVLDATEVMVDAKVPINERVGVLFEKFDEDRLRCSPNCWLYAFLPSCASVFRLGGIFRITFRTTS